MEKQVKGHNNQRDIKLYLVISLVVHALFLAFANYWTKEWDELRNASRWDQKTRDAVEIVLEPKKQNKQKPSQQIAETDLVEKSDQAKDKAYLGLQTQTVQRQTRAKDIAAFRSGKGSGKQEASQSEKEKRESKTNVEMAELGLKADFKPLGHINPADRHAFNTGPSGAATNDHLKDVPIGAQTLLNTREYAYFSFYRRVRRQLEQFWEPGLRHRIHTMVNRGRSLASEKEHSTKLLVVLNDEGTITKIQVEDTSGVVDLDQAAVDAFNRAGPFPNPPRGMIDPDGTVKIEWEFVLKT